MSWPRSSRVQNAAPCDILLGQFQQPECFAEKPPACAGLGPGWGFHGIDHSAARYGSFRDFVGGIAGHGDDLKQVGKLAFGSIVYFEIVTTIALALGLVAVNLVQPGVGVALTGGEPTSAVPQAAITLAGQLAIVPASGSTPP